MGDYNFEERLSFSIESNGRTFEEVILQTLPGSVSVIKTDVETDKTGIDYIDTLVGGAKVYIDLKLREQGCSKYWQNGEPELALETWSVTPENGMNGKAGWTWDTSKRTHYTLHVFDKSDTNKMYLLPFQLLRKAFRTNAKNWIKRYKIGNQTSTKRNQAWKSQCVFVPATVVLESIKIASQCSA